MVTHICLLFLTHECPKLEGMINPTQANVGEYQVQLRNLPKYQEVGDEAYQKIHDPHKVEQAIEKEQAKEFIL